MRPLEFAISDSFTWEEFNTVSVVVTDCCSDADKSEEVCGLGPCDSNSGLDAFKFPSVASVPS